MKKKIIISIIALISIFILYQVFSSKNGEPDFEFVIVSKGNVIREISENGQVKKGEKIELGFNGSGKIETIYVGLGDEVEKGKLLAKLETNNLGIQLQEAKSDLKIYKAQLAKLLSGASQEEIQKYETVVLNARVTLDSAEQNLQDIEDRANDTLKSSYEDAINVLETAYLNSYNAQNFISSFQRTYFAANNQEGLRVKSDKLEISNSVVSMKDSLSQAKEDLEESDMDDTLSVFRDELPDIYASLNDVREISEYPDYRDVVSDTDKTSLDTYRTNINTALTNVVNSEQNISSTKITNRYNINNAQSSVLTAQGTLKSAQDNLLVIEAPADKEDVNLYNAQIEKSGLKISYLEEQIRQSYIIAPIKGQITEVEKEVGETASINSKIFTLSPEVPYEIKVDIYEEDVVKVDVGDSVNISLIAFPDEFFEGEVFLISPAEKIVDGVDYYEVKIIFKKIPETIRTGMTADLAIKAESREDVIVVPEDAVYKKEGKDMVRVLKGDELKEKEVEVGLEGTNDFIEIISGLLEGEKVILL